MLLLLDLDIKYCLMLCEQLYMIASLFVIRLERLQLKDWNALKELQLTSGCDCPV